MAKRARRTHNPGFKAKLALAAVKGEKTLAQLSQSCARSRGQTLWRPGCRLTGFDPASVIPAATEDGKA